MSNVIKSILAITKKTPKPLEEKKNLMGEE
jgi:hypothetical protein